jgi:hypothetical protein
VQCSAVQAQQALLLLLLTAKVTQQQQLHVLAEKGNLLSLNLVHHTQRVYE